MGSASEARTDETNWRVEVNIEWVCPWCGEDLPAEGSYDTSLEAHCSECPVFQREQGYDAMIDRECP